jgi:hypothetical protein
MNRGPQLLSYLLGLVVVMLGLVALHASPVAGSPDTESVDARLMAQLVSYSASR